MTRRPPPAAVAASFGRAARTYLAHAEVQRAMAEWLAEWVPADRSGRAVEAGAGPGLFTDHLGPWSGALTATDVSPAMCAAGRARLPTVVWRPMAAERPLAGPWDWMFSSSLLQWAEDPAAVFAAWREQLAPGGRILAGLFVAGTLAEWESLAGGAGPLTWREPEEWRAALGAAGLRRVRDGRERRTFHHPSARAFLRSLHAVGAAPARRQTAGPLRRLLDLYEAKHRDERGVAATWNFYRFEAAR